MESPPKSLAQRASKPTTQELVERSGSGSLRARWSEVESKRKSEQLYAHFIVRRKVDDRCIVSAGALHCHLLRFKLNLMLFGFADDRPAEILVCALRSQPDSASDLRREVPHILAQLDVGQLAPSDPPARDAGQRKNRQSEDEFHFSHHDQPVIRLTGAKHSAPVHQHFFKRCSPDQTARIGEFILALGFIRSFYGIDSYRER